MEEMKRGLKTRHISMIAIGGSIGTGLFMASGAVITQAGPGGALIAYSIIGVMLYFLMTAIGELATFYPVSGSFSAYSSRFIDPSAGFTVGWLYWVIWALVTSVDILTAAKIITYWDIFQNINPFVWSIIFLVILFLLNAFTVKAFGEAEYWLSFIKVATIIIFLIVGVLVIFGILGGNEPLGLSNFTYKEAPFVNGISGFLGVLLVAGFSFGGTEVVAVTAGESENPKESMPKAIRQVFWRILLFYILAIFVIGMIIPYTNPNLMGGDEIAKSPFTLVFENAGLAFAASFMNAVILTSVLSAGNSGMYASVRMLFSMSKDKLASPVFSKTNKSGVPYTALFATAVVVVLIFAIEHLSGGAYEYIIAASGMTGFIAWLGIAISHYRFRRAFDLQDYDKTKLKYKAKWFPFGPLFAFALCAIVIVGQDVDFIQTGEFEPRRFFITYMGIPVFLAFYIFHKLKYRTKMIPLDKVDLSQDVDMKEFEKNIK